MNIIWKKPDLSLAITSVSNVDNIQTYAEQLKTLGVIPADWIALGFNIQTPASESPENWVFSNGVITVNPVKQTVVPSITMRQARLALLSYGLLDDVETLIVQPNDKIWWEYSPTVERNNSLVIQVLTALGKSSAQIDEMFIRAALL